MGNMETSTIAAIATPPGAGGIGIIKISGPKAIGIAGTLFHHRTNGTAVGDDTNNNTLNIFSLKSHHLYYGHIINPATQRVLDEVLLAIMKAPRSYTREDVVEIQAHSGPAALRAILALILHQGARLAEPGEFTKRAYLSGRIDLTQAEAVIDIINARTEAALQAATNQVNGKLKAAVEDIKNALTDLLVQVEAGIDFPEDVDDILPAKQVIQKIRVSVLNPIEELIKRYRTEHVYRDGLNLVIIGKPNVGKSSLMNCLVQKDRAIVTPNPGTTRDIIEEGLQIKGIPINIIDTAGLHETNDPVETIGIHKAQQSIESASLILFIINAAEPLTKNDHQIYKKYSDKNMILVINKMDLIEQKPSFQMKIPGQWNGIPQAQISALYDTGIGNLKELIVQSAIGDINDFPDHSIIPNLRHEHVLEKVRLAVQTALKGLTESQPTELLSIDIKEAIDQLDTIVGTKPSADILDQIFSNFCIGK